MESVSRKFVHKTTYWKSLDDHPGKVKEEKIAGHTSYDTDDST